MKNYKDLTKQEKKELRLYCFNNKLLDPCNKMGLFEYWYNNYIETGEPMPKYCISEEKYLEYKNLFYTVETEKNSIDTDMLEACEHFVENDYKKRKRIQKYLSKMLQFGKCLFVTLTFTDDAFKKKDGTPKSIVTLEKYVKQYLKSFSLYYIANKDYGKKNGRLHYHALIQCEKVDHKQWKYGTVKALPVVNTNDSIKALSKYVLKLANHSLKNTNKDNRVIYSHDLKKLNVELEKKKAMELYERTGGLELFGLDERVKVQTTACPYDDELPY